MGRTARRTVRLTFSKQEGEHEEVKLERWTEHHGGVGILL